MFTRVQSIIVPVVGPIHTDMVSYCFDAFCAKNKQRKSDMSNTAHLKFNKHEKNDGHF